MAAGRPSGPRPAQRVGGDIPEAPPPPARAQGPHGAGEGVRCDSEAGAVARQAGPGGPESGSRCVRQAEGRARRVRTLEEATRGGAQGTGRDSEAVHGRRRIWGRREGAAQCPHRPGGRLRGELRADQGRDPAARSAAGVRGASGRCGCGPGGRARAVLPARSALRPREPGRRGPGVAPCPLGSGPGLGHAASCPGMNYSRPVPSKLFQFYIFKYLIIRHQTFMQFYQQLWESVLQARDGWPFGVGRSGAASWTDAPRTPRTEGQGRR